MLLRTVLLLLVASVFPILAHGQTRVLWSEMAPNELSQSTGTRQIVPDQARYVALDVQALQTRLAQAQLGTVADLRTASTLVQLPTPDGGTATFRVMETPVFHPDLQVRFPMIRTYSGVGVEDPNSTVKLDLTQRGFHAMVLPGDREAWFIDPLVTGNTTAHQVYRKRDLRRSAAQTFEGCTYDQVNDIPAAEAQTRAWMAQLGTDRVGDCKLRKYRLALACTGEYAAFHGGTVPLVLAAMATTMNRVNGMFERDATLTMEIVANNDQVVYLNAATDPYTNGNGGTMLGENQATCDARIGTANYDIGHVFSTGGGGVASLNSPCSSTRKAQGVTGRGAPVGDAFDIDYVAHEMGHQYGGNHTQNNNCNRAGAAAVEVGSGITIMGYAGICAPDVGANSIAMFGGYSMAEIAANIVSGTSSSCPVEIPLIDETAPTANAGADRTIPRSTPFILTGIGTDPNSGDLLTYSWEQMDAAVATMPPVAISTGGPAWEPLLPKTTPVRYMPNLPAVIANQTPTWEVLSSVGRSYNFRLTVRDNIPGGACNGQDNMVVTVNGASGPFLVTQPNTAVSWTGLSAQTVTWDVAGTNASPVSCANVDILLSTDGGLTYPFAVLANTPNDGSQSITVPNQQSTTARIMVRANDNIFYDISNTNFTITVPSVPDYSLAVTSNTASVCEPLNASYAVQIGSILGYSSNVTLSVSGLPAGLASSFGTNPVTPAGTSTLSITNTGSVAPGEYAFSLNSSSASGPKSLPLTLTILASPAQVSLVAPVNGEPAASGPLVWNADPNAATYTVNIASDAGMNNILETATGVVGTSYQPTTASQPNTTYYWNVRSVNTCGTGQVSATWSYTTSSCAPVTVKIVLDRYGAETTWSIKDASQNVVASGGPYTTVGTNGEYPQPDIQLCLPVGCYDLTINDTANDGMCCAYGSGYIAVVDGSIPLAYAGSFTTSVTVNFCIGSCLTTLPYSEDFETGFGQWAQSFTDSLDWTRLSGTTPSANTGPAGDHTTGSGFYLFTESSSPNFPSKVAELYSPCIDLSGLGTASMTFWYNMLGATMGALNVDVWNGSTWSLGVFSITGNQGANWVQATVALDAYVGGNIRLRFRGITGSGFTSDMAIDDILIDGTASAGISLSAKAFLEGPYKTANGLMSDSLRSNGLIPLTEPYTILGFEMAGGGGETTTSGVFTTAGNDAIVDWVLVELRSTADPTVIVATRAGLLQRDGDIVDVDGSSSLSFPLPNGNYQVAVRHRNHFGCMTADAVALSNSPAVVDLRNTSTGTYGTEALKSIGAVAALWAGNVIVDGSLKYTGTFNDRDPILTRIGGNVATNVVSGYYPEDANLDGDVKYTNAGNDRDIILVNIGGSVATNMRYEQLP